MTGVATGTQFVGERHRGVRARSAVVLLVGFLALLVGLLRVHFDPATAYELDIYRSTPVAFWVGVGLAYLAFLVTAVNTSRWATTFMGLLLGGLATTAIAGLPLIRGYHFYGHSDQMAHLGWVKGIDAGTFDTLDFIYPGTHSLSALVHQTTGLEVGFSMMLVVLCFVVVFVVFVPLSVYCLTDDVRATACAGFSAFLLLPVNNIATELPYFPFLLATFFASARSSSASAWRTARTSPSSWRRFSPPSSSICTPNTSPSPAASASPTRAGICRRAWSSRSPRWPSSFSIRRRRWTSSPSSRR